MITLHIGTFFATAIAVFITGVIVGRKLKKNNK